MISSALSNQSDASEALSSHPRSGVLFEANEKLLEMFTRAAPAGAVPSSMKLRKRDKIVVLFWVPFWTLAAAFVAGIGWMVGLVRHP